MATNEELSRLADQVCNAAGQEYVEGLLDAGDLEGASVYLLGALDACVENGVITPQDAQAHYRTLNMGKENASRIRQAGHPSTRR